MLPRAAELEERFADELAVIGVHSGKYTAEHRTENIRQACARLGLHHPVVNDRHFRIWRGYDVNAWPTVALITPDGYLVGEQAGEFDVEPMAEAIAQVIERYDREGTLRRGPMDFGADPEAPAEPLGELRFPTRLAGGDAETLFVSDTGHHRVLELHLEGPAEANITRTFGSGEDGFADGAAGAARFAEPQGLALDGRTLYVADRRNHAVRAISLEDGAVTTVAGTGELGGYRISAGPGLTTALRSPWGLAVDGGTLYVTMAGSHQLWSLDLRDPQHPLTLAAGSGAEDITDGPARRAALAQTSGVVTAEGRVWFACPEASGIRWMTTGPDAEVSTIVGTGLFDFGDKDGVGDEVELQHALDLAYSEGSLLVADTYNSKIKRIEPASRRCATLPGPAGSGTDLWEPEGIAMTGSGVYVADTDQHRILRLDPASGALTEIAVQRAAVHAGE